MERSMGAMQALDIRALAIFLCFAGVGSLTVAMEEESEPDSNGHQTLRAPPSLAGSFRNNVLFKAARQRALKKITKEDKGSVGEASDVISRPASERHSFPSGEAFYDQTYETVVKFYSYDDPVLFKIITLSRKFAAGEESKGFWKDLVWLLERWIVERSWSNEEKRLPMAKSSKMLIIPFPVPELEVFLTRLVAIEQTLDLFLRVQGSTMSVSMLRKLRRTIVDNISSGVQQARLGGRDGVAQVVSITARVVSSLLSARMHQRSDSLSERAEVFIKVSRSMETLVRLARTPANLRSAMAMMKVVARWLDGEASFDSFSPVGLMGLNDLYKILLISFGTHYMGKADPYESFITDMFVTLEKMELDSVSYQQLSEYVSKLFKGDLKGVMPVDDEYMADEGVVVQIQILPDGRKVARTSEIIYASLFTGSSELILQLNKQLARLLYSPAGETLEAFKLLQKLREFRGQWVNSENKNRQFLNDAQDALNVFFDEFMEDDMGNLTDALAQLRLQENYAERGTGFQIMHRITRGTATSSDESIRSVDTVDTPRRSFVLPVAGEMLGKQ